MSRMRRWGGWLVAAGLLALTTWSGSGVRGQVKTLPPQPGKADPKAFTDVVTLPTNRESGRLIKAAQDYIKLQDWRTATECLQSLLDGKEDSFIEIEGKDDKGNVTKQRVSVRLEANRLIGALPPEGLEFYQVQYGPAADTKLKEALDKGDAQVLAEVAQRYLHTKSGAEATNLLGTYYLDRGSYLMAALSFERLFSRPDADKLPVGVLFKAAVASRRAGDTENADKLWKKLADKADRGELVVGRQKVTVAQLRQELERPADLLVHLSQNDWPVFRGNPAHNAQGVGSTPFLEPRWQTSMTPLDESNSLATADQIGATKRVRALLPLAFTKLEGKPILPAFGPIAAAGKLIYRTYDGVHAVSLKNVDLADGPLKPGDLIWIAAAPSSLHGMERNSQRQMTLEESWYKGPNGYYNMGPAGVFFENSLVGTLSHDGQRVYFVDDLAVPPHPNNAPGNVPGQTSYGQDYDKEVRGSRLVCVELETGRQLWSINDRDINLSRETGEKKETSNAGLELIDTFFLGPPLPLGGKLYQLVEKNAELRLVCLDPIKTHTFTVNGKPAPVYTAPEIVWQQSLGTANVLKLPQDSMRRLQAAHLAYGDGILVCPTNAGVILGVDLLTHSLVWAHSYRDANQTPGGDEMQMFLPRRGRGGMMTTPVRLTDERWRPSSPAIQSGKVVFTAYDANALHCLNLRDGRLLWNVVRKEDDLYFAGVFSGRVVIVSRGSIRALNLDDGKELWSLPTGSLPSGQGVASNDIYYLPLKAYGEQKEPAILAVNLATGTPVAPPARSRKKEPIGNLLFVDGEMISQTALTIAAYPELKRMLAEIDRRLKENPSDPVGLSERGELYLDKGDLTAAIADLRAALAHMPPADTRLKTRTKLHEALTDLFQNDFNTAEKYLSEYHDLCRVDIPADADANLKKTLTDEQLRREANYLSLLGRGREKQGRLLDALAAYEQFGALTGNKELVSSIDEPYTRSRPDVWSRGRIKGMIEQATAEQRKVLEDAVAKRWEVLRGKDDLNDLRKFVAIFGTSFRVGRAAQLSLAERLLTAGGQDDLTEAENKLQSLCSPELRRQDPTTAAQAIDAMIRIYVRLNHYEDAVGFYKQLGAEFANVVVRDGKTGADLLNELFTDKRFLPYLEPHGLTWRGTLKPKEEPGPAQTVSPQLTINPEGDLLPFFDRHRLVLNMNMNTNSLNAWQFRLLDRATNEELWKQDNLPTAIYFYPGQQAFAQNINLLQNAAFLQAQLMMGAGNAGPTAMGLNGLRYAFASGHTLLLHFNNMVFAYNLSERKELWRFNLAGKNSLVSGTSPNNFALDGGRVIAVQSNSGREMVGGVAVVEPSYVCLQTRVTDDASGGSREGLVALDPTRPGPNVLWTKSDVSLRAQVFGDDQHVYVVEPSGNNAPPTVRAFRAEDGVSVPVPDFGALYARQIRTLGRCLLLQEDGADGSKILRLYDVQTGNDVWRQSFTAGAFVVRSENRSVTGVVEKDHSATFLDVRSGRMLFKGVIQAEHAEKLQSAAVVTDRDHFYLALTRTPENGLTWYASAVPAMRSLSLNGPLYAFRRDSGKLAWVCDFVPHQALLLEQLADLPLLLFTAQYQKMAANGNLEHSAVRVTGVDKATGKLIYDKEFGQHDFLQALRTDPLAGVIELVCREVRISFRLDTGRSIR